MKKALIGVVMALSFALASCASIVVDAPVTASNTVSLTSKASKSGQTVHFTKQKKVFYLLWGLVPITNNHTASDIAEVAGSNDVTNLKVDTHYDVIDFLINAFLGGFITLHSKTAVIEGDVVK